MEPLQTWWATELYPSKDEDTFGVAGDFEVVRAADAQAAIAALQDVIKQMGGQAAVLAKDAMAAKEQVAALQERVNGLEKDSELLRQSRDDFRVKYESVKNDAITLQSQLTQRTAELERVRAALLAIQKSCNAHDEYSSWLLGITHDALQHRQWMEG